MKSIRRNLFFLLLIILPVNLGKHFDLDASYISGIIVDYLVPVLYLQDIVALSLIMSWLVSTDLKEIFVFKKRSAVFFVFYIFGLFLSFLSSDYPLTSFSYFFRIVIYSLVALYVVNKSEKDFYISELPKFIAFSLLYAGVLGIVQYIKQGSVFNNYLFLGEQPYNSSIKAILKENLFNVSFIPPYSTFRHPNTFAGFISLTLPFLYLYWNTRRKYIYWFILGLGFICLLLTMSAVALTAFFVSAALIYFYRKSFALTKYLYLIPLIFIVLGLLLPIGINFPGIKHEPSVYRRIELLNQSYTNIYTYLPFGIGIGTSTSLFKSSVFLTRDLSFFQPVHNIFVLLLFEGGLVTFLSFAAFLLFYFRENYLKNKYTLILITQFAVLGSFDHYLMTMHQTLLLSCLLFGLCLVNKDLLDKK
ncbi:O-antigen ligase family protein [candidate division WWE3 bacterium]|uniref:O-antigen ligase family protein n=1 Tax=candidate division WWE3 bacterium TaxID=2053526 RepID=A0A7X9HHD9_UNCKA|nr:O-antigen ligase family protein [candidate division WWE3 bacterium]